MADFVLTSMHANPSRPDRARVVALQESDAALDGRSFHVFNDPEQRGPLHTMIQCLKFAWNSTFYTDWIVVLQDDAEPVPGWLNYLPQVLDKSPQPVLGLSYFGYRYSIPKSPDTGFLVGTYLLQGGAFAIHNSLLARGLIDWLEPLIYQDGFIDDDVALAAFSRWCGRSTACVTYALFQQRLNTMMRGHPRTRPIAQRTIIDLKGESYPSPSESRNIGKASLALTALLQAKWDRQNLIVPAKVSYDEVWM